MKKTIFQLVLVAAVLTFPGFSSAQEKRPDEKKAEADSVGNYRKEGIDVVQARRFLKTYRHEFSLDGGIIANNQFLMYELISPKYTFHLRETLAFELMYAHAFSQEKQIIEDLRNIECPLDGSIVAVPPSSNCPVELKDPPDPLKNAYFGNVIWSPIYGKFALFSKSVLHFDLFLLAGAGMFDNERSNRFAFDVGLGGKIFFNEWMAIRLEFRNITVREGAPFNHVVNNRLASLGFSVFFPTKGQEF